MNKKSIETGSEWLNVNLGDINYQLMLRLNKNVETVSTKLLFYLGIDTFFLSPDLV